MLRIACLAIVCTVAFAHHPGAPLDPEAARLRAHFASVERELLARDVSGLTETQRAARNRHIARLRAYARAGVFPKNTDFPGRVPYFVDRFGTRCAMAFLIEQSGRGDIVSSVAATRNNAFIAELARDPEVRRVLLAWLEENGLSVDEAARIQPSYCDGGLWVGPGPAPLPPGCGQNPTITIPGPATSHALALVLGSGVLVWNATGTRSPLASVVGIASGVIGIALGAPQIEEGGGRANLGALNTGIGLASIYVGIRALLRGSPSVHPPPPIASVAPLVMTEGAGLTFRVTF